MRKSFIQTDCYCASMTNAFYIYITQEQSSYLFGKRTGKNFGTF